MINVGVVGATGYAGEELIDVLLGHPQVRLRHVSAKIAQAMPLDEIFPRFKGKVSLVCAEPDIRSIAANVDLVFLALPHTVSMEMVPKFLAANKRVIDLSADYRLRDTAVYERFYGTSHKDKPSLGKAVYGLPELYRAKIKTAQLIANPGCYPTAGILALAPIAALGGADLSSIIIDAKSGVTGAGRKVSEALLFSEINEDFKAYKVNVHQHAPEINQELSKLAGKKFSVTFVPHLLPLGRGILSTVYVKKAAKSKARAAKTLDMYRRFYQKEPFVRVRAENEFPRLRDVVHTNFCDIGIKEEADSIIIISTIDNLLKGASGQAVQNMNIMYGFPEQTGLL